MRKTMNQGHDARHKRLAQRLSYLRARIAMIRETRVAHEKNPSAEVAGYGLVQVVLVLRLLACAVGSRG